MPIRDSVDKVVEIYIASVCSEPFVYKSKLFQPKPLIVSQGIFRGYTCPPMCGGCCPRFSLDYLPSEAKPENVLRRTVSINNTEFVIYSDMQTDHDSHHCRNLSMSDGRCNIHALRPFSCDFELIRFMRFEDKPNRVTTRLFGRGWNMLRVDGERGAKCEITAKDLKSRADTIRKLRRLKDWCDYFEIESKVQEIINWANLGVKGDLCV